MGTQCPSITSPFPTPHSANRKSKFRRLTVSTATVRIRGKLQEAQGHNSWPSTGTVDTRNAVGHHINNTASNNCNNNINIWEGYHSSKDLRTHKQDASEYLFHRSHL